MTDSPSRGLTNRELLREIQYRLRMCRRDCESLSDPRLKGFIIKEFLELLEEKIDKQIQYGVYER